VDTPTITIFPFPFRRSQVKEIGTGRSPRTLTFSLLLGDLDGGRFFFSPVRERNTSAFVFFPLHTVFFFSRVQHGSSGPFFSFPPREHPRLEAASSLFPSSSVLPFLHSWVRTKGRRLFFFPFLVSSARSRGHRVDHSLSSARRVTRTPLLSSRRVSWPG